MDINLDEESWIFYASTVDPDVFFCNITEINNNDLYKASGRLSRILRHLYLGSEEILSTEDYSYVKGSAFLIGSSMASNSVLAFAEVELVEVNAYASSEDSYPFSGDNFPYHMS